MKTEKKNFNLTIDQLISDLNNLINKPVAENIKAIILKLSETIRIGRMLADEIQHDWIEFDNIPASPGIEFIPSIIDGIRKEKVIELYYQPFYEDKPYFIRVHPYLLKEYRYRWYLIGLNDLKSEIRTYGLDRMLEVRDTSIPYIKKNFKTTDYFKNTVGIISPAGEPPRIRIQVLKPQAHYLITQPIHPSQSIEYEDDMRIIYNYRVHPTYEFKTLILGLGSDAKVLEPASFRNEMIRELDSALKAYSS